jgi:hypothetical protein
VRVIVHRITRMEAIDPRNGDKSTLSMTNPCCDGQLGSPVPFVLRKMSPSDPRLHGLDASQCYEFIGECYLHGKMDGSVVRDKMTEGRPPELFILA